jgi:hypothetical protein
MILKDRFILKDHDNNAVAPQQQRAHRKPASVGGYSARPRRRRRPMTPDSATSQCGRRTRRAAPGPEAPVRPEAAPPEVLRPKAAAPGRSTAASEQTRMACYRTATDLHAVNLLWCIRDSGIRDPGRDRGRLWKVQTLDRDSGDPGLPAGARLGRYSGCSHQGDATTPEKEARRVPPSAASVTACEYSGRPPDTNSHQPSLRPEQHKARSDFFGGGSSFNDGTTQTARKPGLSYLPERGICKTTQEEEEKGKLIRNNHLSAGLPQGEAPA